MMGQKQNSQQPSLRLDSLEIGYRKGRKKFPLCGKISCNVSGGELVSLMGRNGSGKSTLLRTIAGIQEPLAGEIVLAGKPSHELHRREMARLLGFVSTEVVRVEGLRVRDLVAMGRYPYTGWFGNMSREDHKMIERAIELTSLGSLVERDLDELSDGERQRAMIARTLAQDTGILVLDEPTAYLDLIHKYEITSLLRELARDFGNAVVFSTHDLPHTLQEADKLWLLGGQEMVEGRPADLLKSGRVEEILLGGSVLEGIRLDPETGNIGMEK
jgi:iron complex transport system ATP-binding protein